MRQIAPIAVLLFFGCQGQEPASRYEKIGRAYCECTGSLAALNEQAAALSHQADQKANFQEQLKQIQTEYESAKTCTATIIAQYGKLNAADLDSVKMALTGKCVNTPEQADLLKEMLGE